jgi:hypothetical protein
MSLAESGNFALGFFGALGTAYGIFLHFKFKHPSKVVLFIDDVLPLFDRIVKNLPEISIRHRNKKIAPGLILVKAILLNNGNKDITAESIASELSVILPRDCKWISCKTTKTTFGVQSRLNLIDQVLCLSKSLFRRGDLIVFEALLEVPEEKSIKDVEDLRKILSVRHRIADTAEVKIEPMVDVKGGFFKSGKRLKSLSLLVVIGFIMCGIPFLKPNLKNEYTFKFGNELVTDARIELTSPEKVKVSSKKSSIEKEFSNEEFFGAVVGNPRAVVDRRSQLLMVGITTFFYILMPLLFIGYSYARYRKFKKMGSELEACVEVVT